jgi:hypothetical protein
MCHWFASTVHCYQTLSNLSNGSQRLNHWTEGFTGSITGLVPISMGSTAKRPNQSLRRLARLKDRPCNQTGKTGMEPANRAVPHQPDGFPTFQWWASGNGLAPDTEPANRAVPHQPDGFSYFSIVSIRQWLSTRDKDFWSKFDMAYFWSIGISHTNFMIYISSMIHEVSLRQKET